MNEPQEQALQPPLVAGPRTHRPIKDPPKDAPPRPEKDPPDNDPPVKEPPDEDSQSPGGPT